jgi:hypothetical protein
VTDIHLLTNPPTLETSYHLLHSQHPDHYAIFLASPTDPPGEIVFGEVQIPGGLEVGRGEKAIVLHQPEEIISIGDKVCRLGFKFDWTFEYEGKMFKCISRKTRLIVGSRDCIAGIMKSMTLTYLPSREFRDDPPVTLALFSASPSLTLLDYNFPRIQIKDVKGFEVIILLFASLFRDIIKTGGDDVATVLDVKKETQRLQKLEMKEEERVRRQRAEEIDRETERLRILARDEYLAKKMQKEGVERETERLRILEGYPPEKGRVSPAPKKPSPTPKKHWWSSGGQWGQREINEEHGPKYTMTGARMMGYNTY